jgi:alpha-L-fucosidase
LELKTANAVPCFTVTPDASREIKEVDIYYSQQGREAGAKHDMAHTMNRFWQRAKATRDGASWTAELPVLTLDKPLWVYANVLYTLDQPVTGAGYYYGKYTTQVFNLSSRMAIVSPDELKVAGVRATAQPSLLIEAFGPGWEKEWFTYDMSKWARSTHKVYDPQWQAPEGAQLAFAVRSTQPNKLVVSLGGLSSEVSLQGGSQWQQVVLTLKDFRDAKGNALKDWKGIQTLELSAQETLKAKVDGVDKKVVLGGDWVGEPPEFKDLRWVETDRMKWFREARFGLFIHWGVYAVPAGVWKGKSVVQAGEWIKFSANIPTAEYKEFGKGFTAANYDPKAWARLARTAGMKYVVITSKHHDGFVLFDSAASDWNAVKASAAGRDLLAPLAAAVRAEGLKFGCYYSQVQDWTNPGGAFFKGGKQYPPAQPGEFDEYLKKTALPQVREVLDRYQPDIFWWDTPGSISKERAQPFADLLAQHPSIISNDRLGGGFKGDTLTPEQHIPPRGYPGKMFEVCMTMNSTWGFKTSDTRWKSVRDLLRNLSDISSKGGNFLLNVGPTADGRIPEASVERLEAVGRWMQVNGEAIYATEATPFMRRMTWGRITQKVAATGATTLYLHVWDWPKDGRLVLAGLSQVPSAATLLANGEAVTAQPTAEGLVVNLPEKATDPIISVVRLQFTGAVTLNEYPLDAEGRIALTGMDGDGTGGRHGNFKIRGTGADTYLADWKDAEWTLDYRVTLPTAGSWQVSAEFASAEPAKLVLSSGTLSAKVTVPAGADATAWHTEVLATLNLPAGDQSLRLQGEKDGWNAGPNVRRIWLKPVPAVGAKAATP